jgi:tetratricopeptide (TPR) repeat protein
LLDAHRTKTTPALAVLACALACATVTRVNREVDDMVAGHRYAEAARLLEGSEDVYGERDRLLWDLERAMLLHLAGEYEASNTAFEDAKAVAERNYTKSVSQGLGRLALNDRVVDYAGENFERAMIHVFAAINYMQLGMRDEALVEARQLDDLLRKFATNHGGRYTYQEDAFGRYLTGMLYEGAGDSDDAYIAYWQALEAYERYERNYGVGIPASLRDAGARAASHLGEAQHLEFQERWNSTDPGEFSPGRSPLLAPVTGDLVVLHYNGHSPRKVEQFIDMSFGKGWAYVNATTSEGVEADDVATAAAVAASIPASDTIRVALPRYVESTHAIRRVEVRLDDALLLRPVELVQDVGAIAMRDLEDRIWSIRARAIARAAIKYALAKSVSAAAEQSDDQNVRAVGLIVGALLRAYTVASERADTRSWSAVPDEIWMLQARVPSGEHRYDLTFVDEGRRVVERRSGTVRVDPGARSFVIVRTVQ